MFRFIKEIESNLILDQHEFLYCVCVFDVRLFIFLRYWIEEKTFVYAKFIHKSSVSSYAMCERAKIVDKLRFNSDSRRFGFFLSWSVCALAFWPLFLSLLRFSCSHTQNRYPKQRVHFEGDLWPCGFMCYNVPWNKRLSTVWITFSIGVYIFARNWHRFIENLEHGRTSFGARAKEGIFHLKRKKNTNLKPAKKTA